MTQDLLRLVRLQDLDLLMEALADPQRRKLERGWGFTVGDPAALGEEREKLAATINKALVGRYSQLRRRHSRAIVLVRGGICLGCFVRCPARLAGRCRTSVEICESCGRILVVPRALARRADLPAQPHPLAPSPAELERGNAVKTVVP